MLVSICHPINFHRFCFLQSIKSCKFSFFKKAFKIFCFPKDFNFMINDDFALIVTLACKILHKFQFCNGTQGSCYFWLSLFNLCLLLFWQVMFSMFNKLLICLCLADLLFLLTNLAVSPVSMLKVDNHLSNNILLSNLFCVFLMFIQHLFLLHCLFYC